MGDLAYYGPIDFGEYMRALEEEKRRYPRTYAFHGELEEVYAEAADALSGSDSQRTAAADISQENGTDADKN